MVFDGDTRGMKVWVKENIISIIGISATAILTAFGTYYGLRLKDNNLAGQFNELNARVHNLNEKVQSQGEQWDNLIERLDERYVNEKQFQDFRNDMNRQLRNIKDDTDYLIRLQIEQTRE